MPDYQGYAYRSIRPLVTIICTGTAARLSSLGLNYTFVALTFSSSVSLRFTYQDSIGGPRLQRKSKIVESGDSCAG